MSRAAQAREALRNACYCGEYRARRIKGTCAPCDALAALDGAVVLSSEDALAVEREFAALVKREEDKILSLVHAMPAKRREAYLEFLAPASDALARLRAARRQDGS